MGLRVLAIGWCLLRFVLINPNLLSYWIYFSSSDTGETKKKLCLSLGAEKWVDFRESTDLISDVKAATDGLGPEGAVVAAGDVSLSARRRWGELQLKMTVIRPDRSTRPSCIFASKALWSASGCQLLVRC